MRTLARRVGLGLAARGDVTDVIDWTRRARDAGLDSIWVHDSYFERDAISYATAVAVALALDPDSPFKVSLGAVNPYTRHPVVLAMTGSALDEILPERIVMGLGTGLPLRLKQMGIPYSPDEAVARVSSAMDQLRALWAGERIPSGTPGLPPVQPMFPPVHRIPLFIAAYRKDFVQLAGQKADGYLARPAESIPSLRGILERLSASAVEAVRDPSDIESAAYLLSLVDKTRREALNRAKREPFVIYMMSVLGDVSMQRAGFELELRDKIAAAWRAEDFHEAGKLIPDELLDAFMLCGTRDDVAAGAMAFHAETGLDLPLLQPVVQEETQVRELVEAARLYSELPAPVPADRRAAAVEVAASGVAADAAGGSAPTFVSSGRAPSLANDRRLSIFERVRRRLGAAYEVLRPFAITASAIPVLAGGALAAVNGQFEWLPFLAALAGGMLLHSGTNVINEVFDVRRGIDTITSPRMSHAVLKGRLSERGAYAFAIVLFAAAIVVGSYLVWLRGWPIVILGLLGLVAGYTYTAPPFEYKYRALGVPTVFVLMGPIMTVGGYVATSRSWDRHALVQSLPGGLHTAAILHGNEWRDISEDTRAGISTLSSHLGREWAHYGYLFLVIGAYIALALGVAVHWLPPTTVIAVCSLPFLAQVIRSAELGATGQARAIAMIDLQTARLHFAFGALMVSGLLLALVVR
jgi:1,4-dihydroxy-2-naphthoate octaprenyltransferase